VKKTSTITSTQPSASSRVSRLCRSVQLFDNDARDHLIGWLSLVIASIVKNSRSDVDSNLTASKLLHRLHKLIHAVVLLSLSLSRVSTSHRAFLTSQGRTRNFETFSFDSIDDLFDSSHRRRIMQTRNHKWFHLCQRRVQTKLQPLICGVMMTVSHRMCKRRTYNHPSMATMTISDNFKQHPHRLRANK
jgi:hypothetical protein